MNNTGISLWQLTFCSGFAVILGTFGASAQIKYKGITIAGAGAIAVVLYVLISNYNSKMVTNGYITGDITKDNVGLRPDKLVRCFL